MEDGRWKEQWGIRLRSASRAEPKDSRKESSEKITSGGENLKGFAGVPRNKEDATQAPRIRGIKAYCTYGLW